MQCCCAGERMCWRSAVAALLLRATGYPLRRRRGPLVPSPSQEGSPERRQGACEAPMMTNPCERFVRVPHRERIASPSREARASRSDGGAKPIAPTQRLPALHSTRCTRGGDHPSAHERQRDESDVGIYSDDEKVKIVACFVMAGLVPAIHVLLADSLSELGCPGQARA